MLSDGHIGFVRNRLLAEHTVNERGKPSLPESFVTFVHFVVRKSG